VKWPHEDPVEFGRQVYGFAVVCLYYVLPFVAALAAALLLLL
jgi:hypothetical protein